MANPLRALCLLCLCSCVPAFAQDSDAKSLYNQKRYESARARAEEEAKGGSADAMVVLGDIYTFGNGVAQSYAEGIRWYLKAAEAGNAGAMDSLAQSYQFGRGVARDEATALEWYLKAARLGYARSQYMAAFFYDYGRGVDRDFEAAAGWYRKAADSKYPPAMSALGRLYETGAGVKKDYGEATQWYQRAADAGDPHGLAALGNLYENGHAVPEPGGGGMQDSAKAFALFDKAAQLGDGTAMYHLAVAYETGKGVAANRDTAIEWYRKASARGMADATAWLSTHYVAAKPPDAPTNAPNQGPDSVYRVGGSVMQPQVLSKTDPAYTDAARKMAVTGSVLLSLIVGSDGAPRDIKVVRPLGFGLDQHAIETVRTWRFQPGMKGGLPVNVRAQVEVNFRILSGKDQWKPGQMVFEKYDGESGPVATNPLPLVGGGRDVNGSASFEFTVNREGLASDVRVLYASDPKAAEEIAKRIAKWKFGYTDKSDVPAGAVGRVRFVLNEGDDEARKPLYPPAPVTPAK